MKQFRRIPPNRIPLTSAVACLLGWAVCSGCSGMIADQMIRPTTDPLRASALVAERKEVEARWGGAVPGIQL